jgi:N-dimethylarginine dimethylaminohydrolase
VFGASFAHPQRRAEADRHRQHFAAAGARDIAAPTHTNEGEGDFLVVGDVILAGSGFRTDPRAHREAAEFFGRDVLSLELTDPRFYHLDTAVAVLDDDTIAYYPGAFAPDGRRTLERYFPDAVRAEEADALVLGLNSVSDGRHVVMPPGTRRLADALRDRGFDPIEIDLSELLKAGGSVKCCTMELHP